MQAPLTRHALLACVVLTLGALPPAGARADVKVGDELLTNGGFEKLDARGFPAGWTGFPGAKARREGGRAWIEMDCMREKDSILRAVRNGDFWNCFAESSP